ncbi:methylglyoxal reductase (NADPH-dependent) gre2 [Collariella sp. IMI 366227]|nr:methylglyoxal reductase (NADPH-dependent) gre2 [Collariella sp. IMI 366227]
MTKVLLTGGSGFIAAHILAQLLEANHTVVTTVRSETKATKIREAFPTQTASGALTVAIVPDIAQPTAFDEVILTPGLEVVLHTASPFHYRWTDPQTELIDPALIGTTSILRAIARSAPTVRRVVVTSSFAAIVDPARVLDPSTTFSEASWNPVTIDDIHKDQATAYRASKKLAEQAAWDFVRDPANGARFDLVTVNPPMVFGPVVHYLEEGLEGLNTSNERFLDCLRGNWKEGVPGMGLAMIWVDVRDVARAHVKAGLEIAEAGGRRLFTTAGTYSNAMIPQVVGKEFPEYKDLLPTDTKGGELSPQEERFRFDNEATNALLGIDWIPFEKCIVDTVKSLKQVGA